MMQSRIEFLAKIKWYKLTKKQPTEDVQYRAAIPALHNDGMISFEHYNGIIKKTGEVYEFTHDKGKTTFAVGSKFFVYGEWYGKKPVKEKKSKKSNKKS